MDDRPSRREFLARAAVASLLRWPPTTAAEARQSAPAVAATIAPAPAWGTADEIVARIRRPVFPDGTFVITRYGARPSADATAAIRAAIDACAAAGGGTVLVPAGEFLTGAIHLRSRVNLHLAEEAVLRFSQDPAAYLPPVFTRFEGTEFLNYSPFIYAFDQEDIAITGRGTLDGQADADHWWPWAGGARANGHPTQAADRTALVEMGARGVPVTARVFGAGHYMRPNFVQPYRCRRVLIEGVSIRNSPMWEIHPVLCSSVTIRGVTISSHGPNNDGCDPECCRDVLIEGCTFDTGDDCIAIKSGRNDDGRRVGIASENIVIRDCVMKDGHGGVVIGSEISGGARWIFAERCRMDSPRLDRVLRIKTNSVRGGVIEHVYLRDIAVGQVAEAIMAADFFYDEGDAGAHAPLVRDIEMRNITSQKSRSVFNLRGYARAPISDVRVSDCRFDGVQSPDVLEGVRNLTLTRVRVNGASRTERIDR
jgi:polygalacturonase